MVKRKLKALNYHSADKFDINDFEQYKNLVLWLEDQIIRLYKIEERAGLRDVKSDKWMDHYGKYCEDVESPIDYRNKAESLEWLVSHAVKMEYEDNRDEYVNQVSEKLAAQKKQAPDVTSKNPLDNLDFHCAEFKNGVNNLAKLLKINQHPNHLVTLDAVCTLITESVNPENEIVKEGKPFPIMDMDSGLKKEDYVIKQASNALQLLYISDLRDLQTKVNESIVAVQNITADPKTNTKLGKVGY